ncbi:MAG TPA: TonB-dependent receptor, partial [Candidatus Sulfomarinibacteraceae bacterium]|nr:TonB-dependent receptor [Candidatus Sulfomarinibacteraceae bacterium]
MRSVQSFGVLAVLTFATLLIAPAVPAQETSGAIRGTVADEYGTPIAGALVEAVGPVGTVSTTSDGQGEYRFPRVAAGSYRVSSKFEGYIDATADIRVVLGEAVTVDFKMQQGFTDEITVYSDTTAIDFSESQAATSIGQREIDFLPRGREFTDVVTFAAGTVNDNQAGGISIDGASGLENRYIVDGLDTTDPQIGDAAIPLRAEFMEEVQVKSAGYMAEFGGAMGGVINAVTRSGGNEFHGAALLDISNNSWNGSA